MLIWPHLVQRIGGRYQATSTQIEPWKREAWRIGVWLIIVELLVCENLIGNTLNLLGGS